MNDTNIPDPIEPVESGAAIPADTTPPQETPNASVPQGEDASACSVPVDSVSDEEAEDAAAEMSLAEETASETLLPREGLSDEDSGENPISEAESPEDASEIEAPVSVALPDMVGTESIFIEAPITEVPPGIVATDESLSETDPAEESPAPDSPVSAVVPPTESSDSLAPLAPVVEPPSAVVVTPPPVPSRPPVPPVFFVWHPHMNEEREDTEVLPSERLREAYHLLEVTGALHWREVKTHTPDLNLGRAETLTGFHTKAYCQSIVALSEGRANLWSHSQDVYLPTLTHTAPLAGLNVAAARSAIKVAMSQPRARVFTPAGQQPHACRDHFADGHIYNDVLMALADAQAAGVKTAFINLDVEHPRQVQERFYHEPMLTISLHEHPAFLYPHTGIARETGKGAGAGYHVNIPMPPGVSDAGYQLVLEQLILPLLHRYQPQLLVVLGGITAHDSDPASHLRLTSKGYQTTMMALMDAVPRFVLFGGDATNYATAARLWAIALATMAERTNSLPPQIPAAHARLWSGGTFHDTEPLLRSAPYQEYTYALLAHELQLAHSFLREQWDLPDLALPPQLSDQRERIKVHPSGDTTSFTSKEPSRGMTFAGLSHSLGDDDDDEVAARRKPRSSTRSASQWAEPKEDEDTTSERSKPRGRRDDPPPANPLGGERRGGFDSRQNREGGRGSRDAERPSSERPSRESESRFHGTGRGAPESKRGFSRSDEPRDRREESPSTPPPRGQGQRRQEPDNRSRGDSGRGAPKPEERRQDTDSRRRSDAERGTPKPEERREGKPSSNVRPQGGERGERQEPPRTPRTPHSAVLPRSSNTPDKGAEEHSPTPSRSTPRQQEREDSQHPAAPPYRRRERHERGQGGQGNPKPPVTPSADGTPQTPDSRPARRHRPRSRR